MKRVSPFDQNLEKGWMDRVPGKDSDLDFIEMTGLRASDAFAKVV